MADTFTTHYNFDKPQVGADSATWGGLLNANWDLLDGILFTNFALAVPLAGNAAAMTGPLITADVKPAVNTNNKIGASTAPYGDVFTQNVDFYSIGATPVLNGTLLSSGSGLVLKMATAGQMFQIQNSLAVGQYVFDDQGNLTINGTGTATDWRALSDIRLKTDIRPILDPLGKLAQIRGVHFTWKQSGAQCAGVIAQEVREILPEAVSLGLDLLTVSPLAIIGLLVQGINELRARVEALEAR